MKKEYVNACMSPNILSDWKKNVVSKRTIFFMELVWVMH